jgi:hypothetical protein
MMQHTRASLHHMSMFSAYAKTPSYQIRGIAPALACKAREKGSRVWHTCGGGGAFPLTTSAKTNLTLQKMTDGAASYVRGARDAGDGRRATGDGDATTRKCDLVTRESEPSLRYYGLRYPDFTPGTLTRLCMSAGP